MIRALKEAYKKENIDLSEHCHVRCLAHVINLAVQDFLATLKSYRTPEEERLLLEDELGGDCLDKELRHNNGGLITKVFIHYKITNIFGINSRRVSFLFTYSCV